ncbi:MAG: AmmeMemoRadiSam system radical SAM enzyme [bacterium]
MSNKALLWEKLKNGFVRCYVCNHKCVIPQNTIARCFSRKNINGEMVLNTYGLISSIAADPIEKKPVYNYRRGTKVLSVGSFGCNFNCKHCQNWQISQVSAESLANPQIKALLNKSGQLSPEHLVSIIAKNNCQGLSWTYNEPAIWLEYTIDSAKLAKEQGFYTVYVTNGYMTVEALELIAPYLDVFRADVKSMDDKFYEEFCNAKNGHKVRETIERAKQLEMHVEIITNIIPTINDSVDNFEKTAEWIATKLGKDTPWHVTRFFPQYKMAHLPPTPLEKIYEGVEIGKKAGLQYVYAGNV